MLGRVGQLDGGIIVKKEVEVGWASWMEDFFLKGWGVAGR